MNWLVSVPVWGDDHLARFVDHALPALRAALRGFPLPVRFMVHTDRPARIGQAMEGLDVILRPVPRGNDHYRQFGDCHREAVAHAGSDERVALLCADLVVSRELFLACEARFASGKRAVVAAATRTLAPEGPPIGASSADLLAWTLRHPHPMVQACFWGEKSCTPWAVYFRDGEDVTLRGFHLHPVAIVKDRALPFEGTLDIDLLDNFESGEIHVVTSPDELALAEMSPAARPFRLAREAMTPDSIAEWARTRARPVHWWLSTHRIVLQGSGRTEDEAVWREVLQHPVNPLRAAA